MAANYWASSQRAHWTFTRASLAERRRALEAQDEKAVAAYPLPEIRQLSIFFHKEIYRLAKRMNTRQQALATAQMYLRRFYTKVPIRDTNPYLVMATCLYLALKMEECPQHIRVLFQEARTIYGDMIPNDMAKLAECEFFLISEMNSYLIVHHPYRTLTDLTPELGLTPDENNTSWQVINDFCLTDMPLLYPPHVLALTAIFLTVVLKPSQAQQGAAGAGAGAAASAGAAAAAAQQAGSKAAKVVEWYARSKVDMEAVVDCTQEIVGLYELWETTGPAAEKGIKEAIVKMVKQRGTL